MLLYLVLLQAGYPHREMLLSVVCLVKNQSYLWNALVLIQTLIDCVINAVNKNYEAFYIKQTALVHAAQTELGMIYYLKQWGYYLLLSQKPKCPSVPECVSVQLQSLGVGCMPY